MLGHETIAQPHAGVREAARGEELADLFGIRDPRAITASDDVISALTKLAPELVPERYEHPFEELIFAGAGAFARLIAMLDTPSDDTQRAAVVDAIAEIFRLGQVAPSAVAALRRVRASSVSPFLIAIIDRALALSQDNVFLAEQRLCLASENPSCVRTAAKLLGFGRDRQSVATLIALLRPDNVIVADAVIWSLGEVGDAAALPLLHALLSSRVYPEHVLEAIGKIGHQMSIPRLSRVLAGACPHERERAAQALVRVLARNDGHIDIQTVATSLHALARAQLEHDTSRVVRFYCVVIANILGQPIDRSQLHGLLGIELGPSELDAIESLFSRRARRSN